MVFTFKLLALAVVYLAHVAFVQATLFQFCDLRESGVYKDPLIIDEDLVSDVQRVYPASQVNLALARSPERKAVLDGARRARDLNRAASAARSGNRTKRAVGAQYLAANQFNNMCGIQEKRIRYSLDYDGMFCHIAEPQDLSYFTCGNSQCDYNNPFPHFQTFRCEPDTYIYVSAVAFCEDQSIRDQVFYVPINCCCRRYTCDMKKPFKTPRLL